MDFQPINGYSVSRLSAYIVWVTKYRYTIFRRRYQNMMTQSSD